MAQITTAIADTVQKNEEKIQDLKNTCLTGDKLKEQLKMTKTVIDSKQLDRPRTVCSNSHCCSLASSNNNPYTQIKLFKSRCKLIVRTRSFSSKAAFPNVSQAMTLVG